VEPRTEPPLGGLGSDPLGADTPLSSSPYSTEPLSTHLPPTTSAYSDPGMGSAHSGSGYSGSGSSGSGSPGSGYAGSGYAGSPYTRSGADRPGAPRRGDGGRRVRAANSSVAEGVANGFVEASLAFSDEIRGSSTYADILEATAAGILRANGRFLDEFGSAVRRASDDLADSREDLPWSRPDLGIDYDRLADLVAARLAPQVAPAAGTASHRSTADVAATIDYDRLADLISARLEQRFRP